MTMDTDSEVTSSGSSSTINVTVEETSTGPGSDLKKIDIFLHVEPGDFNAPASAPANSHHYEPSGIDVWWKGVDLVINGGPSMVQLELTPKSGWAHRGWTNYTVTVVCDNPKEIQVHGGALYNWGRFKGLMARADFYKLERIKKAGAPEPPPKG